MATGPKIVHKQFNSPIGLYSQQNIQETLNKHLKNLDNGTVGIDFSNPSTDKPGNLANSAVLRMLEEEERNRRGYPKLDPTQVEAILATTQRSNHRFDSIWPPHRTRMTAAKSWAGQLDTTGNEYSEVMMAAKGHLARRGSGKSQKKVVWPPVPETNGYHSSQQPQQPSPNYAQQQQYQPQSQPKPQYHNQNQYQPQEQYQQPHNQYQQPQSQYQQPQNQYQQPQDQYQRGVSPAARQQSGFCEGRRQEQTGLSKLIPFGPGVTAAPVSPAAPYRQGPTSPGIVPQPYKPQQSRWAPVPAPLSPQGYGSQPSYPQQQQQQQFSPQPSQQSQLSPQPQYSPQPNYQDQYQQQRQFEPPPATITLRQQAPVHQKPPPVFSSQPATASFKGGVNMRGDQKWPPQSIKEAVAAENEARRQLARGPACRPRKVHKDYSAFFAQHALTTTYPGYRAPPGTQHYEDHSGRSSY